MTDMQTTPMGPNVRRFVRSAWLLLVAQLIAALFAIGATGWAALYVADLRAERDALRAQVEEFVGTDISATVPVAPPADPADDIVELVDETAVADAPIIVPPAIEEPAAPPTARTRTSRPDRTPTVTPRRPATAAPRPATTRTETPQARRPVPPPQSARRPNRTYPGGLPGDGGGYSEPPYIPGRFAPDTPGTRVPTVPDIDLGGFVGQPDTRNPNPPNDPVPSNDRNPNIQQIR
ncbi:MAG: hypothetical protein AAGE05_10875 [Pseudomonadota bacterium]